MKNLILVGLVILMFGSIALAQDANNAVFGGGRYDEGVVFSFGYSMRVTGNLFSISYIDLGSYQSLSSEMVYMVKVPGAKSLSFGLLAGPGADWTGPYEEDGITAITYLVGAVGILGTYDINDKLGIWGYGKYKAVLEDNTLYKNGYVGGAGLFYRL